jgi:hypothetical protein
MIVSAFFTHSISSVTAVCLTHRNETEAAARACSVTGYQTKQISWPRPFSFRGRQRSTLWPPPFRLSWPPTLGLTPPDVMELALLAGRDR